MSCTTPYYNPYTNTTIPAAPAQQPGSISESTLRWNLPQAGGSDILIEREETTMFTDNFFAPQTQPPLAAQRPASFQQPVQSTFQPPVQSTFQPPIQTPVQPRIQQPAQTTFTGAPLPSTSSQVPETLTNSAFLPAYLRQNLGSLVRIEFLIGTFTNDRVGVLEDVGASYVVLRTLEGNNRIVCDLFSIRFVTIIDENTDPRLVRAFID